jgi:accessory gene regulator B
MDTILINIAGYLAKQSNLDSDQEEIVLYGLRLVYSAVGGVIIIFIVASLAGVLVYSLLVALTNAILRVRAGGAHASFPASCFLLGAGIFTIIGLGVEYTSTLFLDKYLMLIIVPSYFITRSVLIKYAPAETPEKPLGEERKKLLRIKTFNAHNLMFLILLVLSIYIFFELPFSNYLTSNYLFAALLGILWETFTVSPKGYQVIGYLDKIMSKLFSLLRLRQTSSDSDIKI